jgi:hypothetical protein
MSLKCYYQYDDSRFCKNWAMHGSRFCTNHQPPSTPDEIAKLSLPPGLRVTELKDVMHILSEALVGSHLGTVSPSKAYSIGYLALAWMKFKLRVSLDAQEKAIRHQLLISMVDRTTAEIADPDPDPPAVAAQPPSPITPPLHDPWAAGRLAGPVPVADSNGNQPSAAPPQPVDLQQAQARLAELLGFKSDDEDASPGQPAAPRSKPNGSAAARPTGKTRDPAA